MSDQARREADIEAMARAIDEALPESDTLSLAPSQIRRAARAPYAIVSKGISEAAANDARIDRVARMTESMRRQMPNDGLVEALDYVLARATLSGASE